MLDHISVKPAMTKAGNYAWRKLYSNPPLKLKWYVFRNFRFLTLRLNTSDNKGIQHAIYQITQDTYNKWVFYYVKYFLFIFAFVWCLFGIDFTFFDLVKALLIVHVYMPAAILQIPNPRSSVQNRYSK